MNGKRKKIVFVDRETIGPDVDLVHPETDHEWIEYERTDPVDVLDRITGAEIVITNKVPLAGEVIKTAATAGLKMIQVAATGYDVVDVQAAKAAGVAVSNVRNYAGATVPEHTFALLLALRRSIVGYRQDVERGEWSKSGQFCFFNHPIRELAGSTIGIIGEGAIGQSVAGIARAFGMRVWFASHKGVEGLGPLYTPFDQVIAESDVITLHCPLSEKTRNMIAMPEFKAMKRHPLIINTARGGLVNEADLLAALDQDLIAGFGFDTLVTEPAADDDPMIAALDRPNVIVTPHVAWASSEAMQALWNQVADQIDRFVSGSSFNRIV
ncbi:D-2-hydroxyacid dehydrogenase [Stappia sp. ES.058]|uniref:D-2-hydroxyacid dehydrogenase n=1 Tax=Stappia sp. ES.058 TaxID=1881061 RepID=UPI00087D8204|nr:D-2-hydroxyacid dehydrogenase [Stappia sp. ES.058]SDU43225.1 glycerate dehydrogenase [Stappia sp. ES.058]